uniref:Uncharacterized protein n=1 Tax=Kalanchoe fedtschenkoi TaxID=63787 RepID=A0A7N0U5B9_KALFE
MAVKRLAPGSGQGDCEFKNERRERLLVYEYVPKGSLDQFIFDPLNRTCLDWETRFKIIGGIAKGPLYVYEDSRYYKS